MNVWPQPNDRFRVWTLRRWYAACWVLLGLTPVVISESDEAGTGMYWALALSAVFVLCYAVLERFPDNRLLRPHTFLWILVLGLGAISCLRGATATLLIATLPHFWIFARGPRSAVAFSGGGTVATLVGPLVWQSGDTAFLTGNAVAAFLGYAASVPLGLLVHRLIEQNEARARFLSAELESAQQRLAEAHRRQGATDERERLAREIHDTLAQGFASIVVLAEAARTGLPADPRRSAEQLLSIERTARDNLAEARVLVSSGAPRSGVGLGQVAPALRRTLDRFAEDTGLAVSAELPDVACDRQTRIALLRCTQESLANVRKHADASTVGIVLARHPHGFELEITDDGRGFLLEDSRGFGLDGMRKRLAELGGELTVTSSLGEGTRVLAMIPTNDQV